MCDVEVEVQGSQCSFTTYADLQLLYSFISIECLLNCDLLSSLDDLYKYENIQMCEIFRGGKHSWGGNIQALEIIRSGHSPKKGKAAGHKAEKENESRKGV